MVAETFRYLIDTISNYLLNQFNPASGKPGTLAISLNMKKITLLLCLNLAMVMNTYACKCAIVGSLETFLKERFSASDFVISAKVELVMDSLTKGNYIMSSDPVYFRQGGYNVVLKLGKVFKGDIKTDMVEITPSWSNCSQYFKTGDTYIVFGNVNKDGKFTTSICSGNFSTAKEDKLKLLNKIEKNKT